MGNDTMTNEILFDFSDYTDITLSNSGFYSFTAAADPATVTKAAGTGSAGMFAKATFAFGAFTFKNFDWTCYFKINMSQITGQTRRGLRLTLDDDGYIEARISTNDLIIVTDQGNSSIAAENLSDSTDYWIKMTAVVSGNNRNISMAYIQSSAATPPSAGYTEPAAVQNLSYTASKSLYPASAYIELYQESGGNTVTGTIMTFDYVQLISSGTFVDDPLASLGTFKISNTEYRSQIGGEGKAIIKIEDTFLSGITALKADLLNKELRIVENTYGNVMFFGEIKKLFISANYVQIEAVNAAKKMLNTRAKTNPLANTYTIKHVNGSVIHDWNASFPTDNSWDNKLIAFTKKDRYTLQVHPTSWNTRLSSDDSLYTPTQTNGSTDTRLGDVDDLYYLLTGDALTTGIYSYDAVASGEPDQYYDDLLFDFWIHKDTPLTSVFFKELLVQLHTKKLNQVTSPYIGSSGAYPSFNLYRYDTSVWVEVFDFNGDDRALSGTTGVFPSGSGGSGEDKSPLMSISLAQDDLGGVALSSFLDDLGDVGDYTKYRLRLGINHGITDTAGADTNDIWVRKVQLNLDIYDEQIPEESISEVASTTASTVTVKTGANVSFLATNKDLPAADGFDDTDTFVVADDAETLFSNIWANSGLSTYFTLEWLTNFGNNFPVLRDLTYEMVYNLLQEITSALNGVWWAYYNTANTPSRTIKVTNPSNLTSTGITLTNADFAWYHDNNLTIEFDAESIFDEVLVIGDGVTATATGTEEYAHSLGEEVLIIEDPDIELQKKADDKATALKTIHSSARKFITVTLNFTDPPQNYSAIQLGKTIAVTTTTVDFSSGGADGEELLIYAIEGNRSAKQQIDLITLTLQERFS